MTEAPTDGPNPRSADFVQSLERGLAVIKAFDADDRSLTLSRGRPQDRPDPRRGAPVPAHAGRAGLRPHGRPVLLPAARGARAGLRLPVRAVAARGRPPAHGGAHRPAARVDLHLGARRHQRRLRRPRGGQADHDRGHQRRHPVPRARHLDGTGPAGPRTGRLAADLPRDRRPAADHAADRHRPGHAPRRSWSRSAATATPSSTRSWSSGCARSPCRCTTRAGRSSPR